MGTNRRVSLACAVALTLASWVMPASAQEQLSDLTVSKYMDWAWQQLPDKFTDTDGEVITFDKSKKETILVPVETARDVILAGWRSVRAQVCELPDDQRANFESLKARENAKKTWTKQQTKYMLMLHLTVVQLLTGKIKVTVKDGETVVSQEELPGKAIKPCAAGEREKLKETILAYVKSGPTIPGVAPQPPPAPAAKKEPPAPAAKKETAPPPAKK